MRSQANRSWFVAAAISVGIVFAITGSFIALNANIGVNGPTERAPPDYYVSAQTVIDTPAGSTIIERSDNRIKDVGPIQKAIRKAASVQKNKNVQIKVNKTQYKQVRSALDSTKSYKKEGSIGETYVRVNEKVVSFTAYGARAA